MRTRSNAVDTLQINFQLLMVFFFGLAAWYFWPTSMVWWGYALTSVGCGACAISLTSKAIGTMFRVRDHRLLIQDHLNATRPSEQASLVSDDALHRAGMTK